jgi:hypothetical protein
MIIDATVGTLFFGRILWEFIMEQEDSQNGHGGNDVAGKDAGRRRERYVKYYIQVHRINDMICASINQRLSDGEIYGISV